MADYHLLDAIPPAEHAAVAEFTSTYDVTDAFNAMMAESGTKRIILPPGRVCVSSRIYGATSVDIIGSRTEIFSLGIANGGHPYHATFWFQDQNDWNIFGRLRINGNRANRQLTPGEAGILIIGGEQMSIKDVQVVNHPGDGIAVGSSGAGPYDRAKVGTLTNVIMEGNGRNGISFDGVYDFNLFGCRTRAHVHGSPKSGVALEPHNANENIQFFGHSSVDNAMHDVYATNGYGPNIGIRFFGGRIPKLYMPDGADVELSGTLRS